MEVDFIEKKAKEDPSFRFPCLIQTSSPIESWPENVKPDSAINGEFYTARITYEQLKKVGTMPQIRAMTIC